MNAHFDLWKRFTFMCTFKFAAIKHKSSSFERVYIPNAYLSTLDVSIYNASMLR